MWVDSQTDILCFTLHLDGKTSFGDQVTGINPDNTGAQESLSTGFKKKFG